MKILAWNYSGLAKAATVRVLRTLVRSHHPSILFLSELKLSSPCRISKILKSVGFMHFHFVPAIGLAGVLAICWNSSVQLNVVVSNSFLINCMILSLDRVSFGNSLGCIAPLVTHQSLLSLMI